MQHKMAGFLFTGRKEACAVRRKTKKPPRPIRRRIRIFLLLVLSLLLGYFYIVQTAFKPTLEELAEYECRAIVVKAMNRAVASEMATHPQRYENLYSFLYTDSGEIQALYADTAALNQARISLLTAVEDALSVLEQTNLEIPYGSLTGITALGGLGPTWELTLLPDAYVEGTLQEQVQSVSVNRTQYTISLNLCVTISMVLDGNTATAQVSDQIPVASFLLDGNIPAYYSAGSQ